MLRPLSIRSSVRSVLLNFGPQHPAAHGILKIGLALSGEIVTRADATFGLLHRGSEKLCEARTLSQAVPYLDRMDYVANLIQEHALVAAVEGVDTTRRVTASLASFRVMCDELSRVLNHLLTMSAICLDLGSMGPVFWAFEERELIMTVFEYLSGARMHTALYRPFSLGCGVDVGVVTPAVLNLVQRGARVINGAFVTLLSNRAFKSRASHIGAFSPLKIKAYGVSGVIARASGVCVDARLGLGAPSYASYPTTSLRTFLGRRGDVYDRFLLRVREVITSYDVILASLASLSHTNTELTRRSKFASMEGVISHFKRASAGYVSSRGFAMSAIEGPKGFVGVALVAGGDVSPYRLHVRSPVAHNLHLLTSQCNGQTFADFVSTFCSMDVVLGEIDR